MSLSWRARFKQARRDRRATISLIAAASLLPIMLAAGLAIDFGFYVQAEAQLNLAADAAAMYAAQAAAQNFLNGNVSAALTVGQTAGQQWFAAQIGQLPTAVVPSFKATVALNYTQNPGGFSTSVSYTGQVNSYLGGLFGYATYTVSGLASTSISNYYVEVVMLLDNSGSMLVGASTADIIKLETATPCSTQSANEGRSMAYNYYTWNYTGNYGYSVGNSPPPTSTSNGACDSRYDGDSSVCFYAPAAIASQINGSGQCKNGGGASGTFGPHTPQAPCAFACHDSASNNDYYGLARSLNVTLRLDVVIQSSANVVKSLQKKQQSPNQFMVGVYQFNSSLSQVYPTSGSGEAGTDLATALQSINALTVPVSQNGPFTDFGSSINTLASTVSQGGDGVLQSAPRKSLFIVTDGVNFNSLGAVSAMTSSTNEQLCKKLKDKGFTVYVLRTPYQPVPFWVYLSNVKPIAEPSTAGGTSTVEAALKACATSPATYYTASDPTAINSIMQQMLASALNSAGRITN